jgi:lipid II:glycine glycyltransferase (peptidoglycan interpeptide bridge formation enzyme)
MSTNLPKSRDRLQKAILKKEKEFQKAQDEGKSNPELNSIYKELKELRLQFELSGPGMEAVAKSL